MRDPEIAAELARIYSNSCGVECTVVDIHGIELYKAGCAAGCDFCAKAREYPGVAEVCRSSHLYGSYQAERFGGRYIFFCPFGLVHWTSPIISEGRLAGSLLGGPVLMIDPDEFLLDEMILKSGMKASILEVLKSEARKIKVVSPEKVRSMSEMLFITAMHISGSGRELYMAGEKITAQQSDISGYIHSLKQGNQASYQSEVKSGSYVSYPIVREKILLSAVSRGDKSNSQKILNEMLGHIFFSSGNDFGIIKTRILELLVLLSRAAMEGGADDREIFGMNYDYIGSINSFDNVEQLAYWLSEIMKRFTDCVFNLKGVKHIDVIYKALEYIRNNHMRKITLDEVASHVYLSPSYFSSLFKREMKTNFSSYLNLKRVETSKRLLADSSVNLLEIAGLSGFEDQSYFTKVFKKYTGTSPGKYRESMIPDT